MAAASVEEMLPPPLNPAGPRTLEGNRAFHNFYNDYSHISDPNLRRRLALSEIDKVPFGLSRMCMPLGRSLIRTFLWPRQVLE